MSIEKTEPSHSLLGVPGRARQAVIWLIVLTGIYRLWASVAVDLVVGEAYYVSSARLLHLGYFDQPPISLWIAWAVETLFPAADAWLLRLPYVLLFVPATWLVYRLGARFRSEWAGFLAALIMNVSVLFTISIGAFVQPDAPLVLFWLLASWLLVSVFFDDLTPAEQTRKWIWAGIWLGLAFMTKYHAVFLPLGAGLYMLTNKEARKHFLRPGPYLGVLAALIVCVPVVVWNASNGWASFSFQGGRAFGYQFHPEWLIRMILGQLVYITPWLAVPALWAAGIVLAKGPRGLFPKDTQSGFGWFLVMLGLPAILFFTAVAAWHDTQYHFHWQAPGYMMLFVLLGAWADAAWARHRRWLIAWLAISTLLSYALLIAVTTHTATGWARNVLPNGQTIEDPTEGAIEWRELGAWFDESGIADANAFVAGLHWTRCGQIDTPLAGRLPLACLSDDPRNIAFNIDLEDMVGRDAYIVVRYGNPETVEAAYGQFFDKMETVARLDIRRSGFIEVHDLYVVKGTNFHLNRAVPVPGGASATILRLPRTRITALAGTIANAGPARSVDIRLDGKPIGSVDLAAGTATAFDLTVPDPDWSVGSVDMVLTIEGDTEGLDLNSLIVRQN